METFTNGESAQNDAAERIERRIARYRTTKLTDHQANALASLKDLVRKAAPSSVEDAKCLLGSGCTFLAWAAGTGPCDVAHVLTEVGVARWSHAMKQAEMNNSTLANHLGRLNRLLRVKAGLPAWSRRRAASTATSAPPYYLVDLTNLVADLSEDDRPAAVLVVAGAACGVVATTAAGGTFQRQSGLVEFVLADGSSRPTANPWMAAAATLLGVAVDDDAWNRARTASEDRPTGALTARRLHMTWSTTVLSDGRALATVLSHGGLTRRTLDTSRPHLPSLRQADSDRLLRG